MTGTPPSAKWAAAAAWSSRPACLQALLLPGAQSASGLESWMGPTGVRTVLCVSWPGPARRLQSRASRARVQPPAPGKAQRRVPA